MVRWVTSTQVEPGTKGSLPGAGSCVASGGGAGEPFATSDGDSWGGGGAVWLGGAVAGALTGDGVT